MSINNLTAFWDLTDSDKLATEFSSNKELQTLSTLEQDKLISVFSGYRFFVEYFISDLEILSSLCGDYPHFKEIIDEILFDEQGGEDGENHLALWDNFVMSLGATPEDLKPESHQANIAILESRRAQLQKRGLGYAIGCLGLGSECLCAVYLTAAKTHLLQNEWIKENFDSIDWVFWDIHTGEADEEHIQMLKDGLSKVIEVQPELLNDVVEGYKDAKREWEDFWSNIYA